MFQRSLRSVSYGSVVQTTAGSQHSSGGGSPVMCVKFLTCCTDTSRVSPEERYRNTNTFSRQNRWHKRPARVKSGIMRTMSVVFTQRWMLKVVCGRQEKCIYFVTWPLPVMNKKRRREMTCVLAQILQCNRMESNLALKNYCAATEYLNSDT